MKKSIVATIALLLVLSLSGCGCDHSWKSATCTQPATCTRCGEKYGTTIAHDFPEVTCKSSATCKLCGKATINAAQHTFEPATYTDPKTCSVCGKTEGEPLSTYYLTGSEYEAVNALFEGGWEGYEGTSYIEYYLEDGAFICEATLGSSKIRNYGTYKLTNATIELYFQNGTKKIVPYELNGGRPVWDPGNN